MRKAKVSLVQCSAKLPLWTKYFINDIVFLLTISFVALDTFSSTILMMINGFYEANNALNFINMFGRLGVVLSFLAIFIINLVIYYFSYRYTKKHNHQIAGVLWFMLLFLALMRLIIGIQNLRLLTW